MKNGVKDELRVLLSKYGPFFILLAMLIILSIISPYFFTVLNLTTILIQTAVVAIIAIGQTLVIITGGIDLSVGSYLCLSAIIAGLMITSGLPLALSLILALVFGSFLGFINGFIVTKMKVPPFIATLGTMGMARGTALVITGGLPVSRLPEALAWFGRGTILGMPVPPIIFVVTALFFSWVLISTRLGRYIYAIGSNREATKLSGINTDKYLLIVYVIAGFLSSLAGIVLIGRLGSAHPTAGIGYELNTIAAAVIGGTSLSGGIGKISGTIIGALIMGVLNNGFTLLGVSSFYQQIAIGAVVVLAVFADVLQQGKVKQ